MGLTGSDGRLARAEPVGLRARAVLTLDLVMTAAAIPRRPPGARAPAVRVCPTVATEVPRTWRSPAAVAAVGVATPQLRAGSIGRPSRRQRRGAEAGGNQRSEALPQEAPA